MKWQQRRVKVKFTGVNEIETYSLMPWDQCLCVQEDFSVYLLYYVSVHSFLVLECFETMIPLLHCAI